MAALVMTIIGFLIWLLMFLSMRDPMRFFWLSSTLAAGYHQRMVLDRWQRISMRIVAVVFSFFGLSLSVNGLSSALHNRVLGRVSTGLWLALGILFLCAWIFGLVSLIVRSIVRGSITAVLWTDWWKMYRDGITLGPIEVFPAITPAMHKERWIFTAAYFALVAIVICISIYPR